MKSIKIAEKIQTAAAATPQTEPAPRRHPVGNLFTPIKGDDNATVDQVTQAMQGLDSSDLQDMLALTYALKNGTGSGTPIEELIQGLLLAYGYFGGCVTPEDVENTVRQFRDNWEGTTSDVEGMAQRYPHMFSVVGAGETGGSAEAASAGGGEAKTAESMVASGDEPAPQTTTARLAANAFERCTETLASLRKRMLLHQDEGTRYLVDDLAGAGLLAEILEDWESSAFADKYPKEHGLLGAIRGNLKL